MTRNYIKSAALSLVALVASSTQVQAAPGRSITYVAQYQHALELRQTCDQVMYGNLESVANTLNHFRHLTGHFPEAGTEQERVIRFLHQTIKRNPYSKTGVASSAEGTPCKITFINDMQLNRTAFESAKKTVPSSWKAEPGDITVITNTENRLLIWAASSDGRPLVDPKTYTYKNLYCDLSEVADDGQFY